MPISLKSQKESIMYKCLDWTSQDCYFVLWTSNLSASESETAPASGSSQLRPGDLRGAERGGAVQVQWRGPAGLERLSPGSLSELQEDLPPQLPGVSPEKLHPGQPHGET